MDSHTDPEVLGAYLHEHIPISRAMGITVAEACYDHVELAAPIRQNINHQSTVFGGSAAAVAIPAGWSLVHVRLTGIGSDGGIVIQRTSVEYLHPIEDDFTAVALAPDESVWSRFVKTLERRGRGRLTVDVELRIGEEVLGTCRGDYVVLPASPGGSRSAGGEA